MSEQSPVPKAPIRRPRWPGLIWAVPIAALMIVAWLALQDYLAQGPTVTVEFPTTGGIKADHTVVKFRGVTVGHVTRTRLSRSLQEMYVTLRFDPYMAGHLGKGTRYWIGGAEVNLTDLRSLKSLIAGPYIGVDPHPGPSIQKVRGLTQEPVLKSEPKGLTLVLDSNRFEGVNRGAPVFYKGMQIGEVRGKAAAPGEQRFRVYVFIAERFLHLINTHSRFYLSGNIQFHLFGKDSGLHIPPTNAIFSGAISVMSLCSGAEPKADQHFFLYPNQEAARWAPSAQAVPYQVLIPGGPQGLQTGSSVLLEGVRVGTVQQVKMYYDARSHQLQTRVLFDLEPESIPLVGEAWPARDDQRAMNTMIASLITKGLRATVGQSPAIVGPTQLDLTMHRSAPKAILVSARPPRIPFVSGSSLADTLGQVDGILRQIHALPLAAIARNLQATTAQLAVLSQSAQTHRTLANLAAASRHLNAILQSSQSQLPAILKQIHQASQATAQAAHSAQELLSAEGENAPETSNLPRTLYQLNRASESLRSLSDYLDQHPNALILGKEP